jgi:hypothetical protein
MSRPKRRNSVVMAVENIADAAQKSSTLAPQRQKQPKQQHKQHQQQHREDNKEDDVPPRDLVSAMNAAARFDLADNPFAVAAAASSQQVCSVSALHARFALVASSPANPFR